jgi:hypothetical protein
MKRVIDTSEVLGTVEMPEGPCEICVSADAHYDESAARLIVHLDAFLRTTDLRTKERRLSADWLPKMENVTESAGPDDTVALAKDIFHRWVKKVREVAPSLRSC